MNDEVVRVERHVPVSMRDGVRLCTDIYFPSSAMWNGEKLPALLLRTPYDKSARDRTELAERFARAGYVVLVQDCRGRFRSEGFFTLGLHEAADGYDTVEWAARQSWSNGKIGTIGTSYMAWVQSALATMNPPHLAAMWVHEGIANGLKESVRQGGAFELRWMGWAFYGAATDPRVTELTRSTLTQIDLRNWLGLYLPQPGNSPLALVPHQEAWYWRCLTTGTEGELWNSRGLNVERYYAEHADVPTVYSGGWYDSYTRATIRNFLGLSAMKKSPQFLLVGPWTHGSKEPGFTFAGDVDFGSAAAIDYFELRRRWFDYWMKGRGENPLPKVKYFVMGGGSGRKNREGRLDHGGWWEEGNAWPPLQSEPRAFYCYPDGQLRMDTPPGEADAGVFTYTYDPRNPVPTIGGNISFLSYVRALPDDMVQVPVMERLFPVSPVGGWDQITHPGIFAARPPYGPLIRRLDVVSFVTEPLLKPVMVCGPIIVELFVTSDAPDTDFTAKMIDWYPPSVDYPGGYALNISDGIQRLRFAFGYEEEVLHTPGKIIPIRIELYPSANLFAEGHRIRLDISSSNFPRFDLNPNTGEPLGRSRTWRVARNSVFIGPKHPSRIELFVSR